MIRLTWDNHRVTGHLELCPDCAALMARIFKQMGITVWIEGGGYQKCQRCRALRRKAA